MEHNQSVKKIVQVSAHSDTLGEIVWVWDEETLVRNCIQLFWVAERVSCGGGKQGKEMAHGCGEETCRSTCCSGLLLRRLHTTVTYVAAHGEAKVSDRVHCEVAVGLPDGCGFQLK